MGTITRFSFCLRCYEKGRPRKGDWFVRNNTNNELYTIAKTLKTGMLGFTPHIYVIKSSNEKRVVFKKYCGIVGCGGIRLTKDGEEYVINFSNGEDGIMSTRDWNALVLAEDDPEFKLQ